MTLERNPRERLDKIERELDRDGLDDELRAEIDNELPDVYQEYIALNSDKAFEQHMATYISDAYAEYQRGERGPLCSCSVPTCALTNGKLPGTLQYNAESVFEQADGRKRVLEYMQKHSGAEVLSDMLSTWDRREGELHRRISKIHNRLIEARTESYREVPTQ